MNTTASSAFDTQAFRRALGCFPTGVAVVTAKPDNDPPVGITVNSFASVSMNPPLVLWSLRRDSPSRNAFSAAGNFVINVLGSHQTHLAHHFATPSNNKFEGVETVANTWGAPCIRGGVAQFECSILTHYEGGDHIIFLGRVEHFHRSDGVPLVFWNGRFAAAS